MEENEEGKPCALCAGCPPFRPKIEDGTRIKSDTLICSKCGGSKKEYTYIYLKGLFCDECLTGAKDTRE